MFEKNKAGPYQMGNLRILCETLLEKKDQRNWNRVGDRTEHLKGEVKTDLK